MTDGAEDGAGRDYRDRFVDRSVLSRRRPERPPSRWRRDERDRSGGDLPDGSQSRSS